MTDEPNNGEDTRRIGSLHWNSEAEDFDKKDILLGIMSEGYTATLAEGNYMIIESKE